eukprot:1003328-Prorocentrum_minimum.AAC.1
MRTRLKICGDVDRLLEGSKGERWQHQGSGPKYVTPRVSPIGDPSRSAWGDSPTTRPQGQGRLLLIVGAGILPGEEGSAQGEKCDGGWREACMPHRGRHDIGVWRVLRAVRE